MWLYYSLRTDIVNISSVTGADAFLQKKRRHQFNAQYSIVKSN